MSDEWKTLSRSDAEQEFNMLVETKKYNLDMDCHSLRNSLFQIYRDTLKELNISEEEISKKAYQFDCLFGIKMFNLFRSEYNMTVRDASSDDIWRYLTLKVIPDIVDKRWGYDHPERFWVRSKRIWLSQIWWYIYLSWQGSVKATEIALEGNSTDTIVQLVDRCGKGYREILCRELIKELSNYDPKQRGSIFRKVMVLNTTYSVSIDPYLVDGGPQKYVKNLFEYVQ